MRLAFGLSFNDLYQREGAGARRPGVSRFLRDADSALHHKLVAARANPPEKKAESDLLVALAPHFRGLHRQALRHRGRGASAG